MKQLNKAKKGLSKNLKSPTKTVKKYGSRADVFTEIKGLMEVMIRTHGHCGHFVSSSRQSRRN